MLLIDFAPYVPRSIIRATPLHVNCGDPGRESDNLLLPARLKIRATPLHVNCGDPGREMQNMSREQQRLLDGLSDFVPYDFLEAGVTVALPASDLGRDASKEATLGEFAFGRPGAAFGAGIGSIDAGDGSAVAARESLEKNIA